MRDDGTILAPLERDSQTPFALGETPRTWQEFLTDAASVAFSLEAAYRRAGGRAAPVQWMVACADRYHCAVAMLAVWSLGDVAALPPNGRVETIDALCAERENHRRHPRRRRQGGGGRESTSAGYSERERRRSPRPASPRTSRSCACIRRARPGFTSPAPRPPGNCSGRRRCWCASSTWGPAPACWPRFRPITSTACSSACWSPSWAAAPSFAAPPIMRRPSWVKRVAGGERARQRSPPTSTG